MSLLYWSSLLSLSLSPSCSSRFDPRWIFFLLPPIVGGVTEFHGGCGSYGSTANRCRSASPADSVFSNGPQVSRGWRNNWLFYWCCSDSIFICKYEAGVRGELRVWNSPIGAGTVVQKVRESGARWHEVWYTLYLLHLEKNLLRRSMFTLIHRMLDFE